MHFSTADLYDVHGDAVGVCAPVFRDFGGRSFFFGQAETVKCFEDNSRVKEALAEPGQGRVLVVDAGGSARCAMLGDLIAESAVDNGWAGVVMHGSVRDVARLAMLDIGIKALAATPRNSMRRGEGQRGLRLEIAGVHISPGDWIYCDADGVIVSDTRLTS
jgi:regulator of ribonuclease activity A